MPATLSLAWLSHGQLCRNSLITVAAAPGKSLISRPRYVPGAPPLANALEQPEGDKPHELPPSQLSGDPASRHEVATTHLPSLTHHAERFALRPREGPRRRNVADFNVSEWRQPDSPEIEILGSQRAAAAKDHRRLQHGLELAHVSSPLLVLHDRDRLACDALDREPVSVVQLEPDMLNEQGMSSRRARTGGTSRTTTIVEILAKASTLHRGAVRQAAGAPLVALTRRQGGAATHRRAATPPIFRRHLVIHFEVALDTDRRGRNPDGRVRASNTCTEQPDTLRRDRKGHASRRPEHASYLQRR